MRVISRFRLLALASYLLSSQTTSLRDIYCGGSERHLGHVCFSAAHRHGVEIANVPQTESRRLWDIRAGVHVSHIPFC